MPSTKIRVAFLELTALREASFWGPDDWRPSFKVDGKAAGPSDVAFEVRAGNAFQLGVFFMMDIELAVQ